MACKTRHVTTIGVFAVLFVASANAATDNRAGRELAPIEPQGSMSVDRDGHQATVLRSGLVFISGGCGGNGCESVRGSVELFDPASGPDAVAIFPKTHTVVVAGGAAAFDVWTPGQ